MNADIEKFRELRAHFPVVQEWAYFESAGTGLVPDFVYEGERRYIDSRYRCGGDSFWQYEDGLVGTLEMMQRSKEALARMIHSSAENLAFGQSATQMFTIVTEGIDYEPEDNIVTVEGGWIGSRFAWQKRQSEGLDVRFVQTEKGVITAQMLIDACDEHTRAIAVNLVESTTGYRVDIDRLGRWCRSNHILLFVDAVQALGVLNVDVQRSNIDFMVGNDYKWMMNFCGTGFAYMSPQVHKLVKHWGVGWMSDEDRFNMSKEHIDIRSDAGRFEIGHQHTDGIYGLGLVADRNRKLGVPHMEAYVLDLADYFRQCVRETPGVHLTYDFPSENNSQIISLQLEPSVPVTTEDFRAAKVFTQIREPDEDGLREIRVGLHVYNNREDVDRFFAVIRQA